MKVDITIDGVAIRCKQDRLVVNVAADNGIYLPTLCYLKHQNPLGTCRVCSVRADGAVVSGCSLRAREGLVVELNTPELVDLRSAVVEQLFVEGNHNCPSCEKSGRCQLQAVGYDIGMAAPRFPYRYPVRPADHASDRIWLERDRCILCERCVELIRDRRTGKAIFTISRRGPHMQVEVDADLADRMPPQQVHQAVAICPVGAILEKGVGYDEPIGHRKFEVRSLRARALGGSEI
ncbi:MAG: 2Fe-2S iron-sulfur cluster-binding protein [Dermatophilaceae bacterium]